MLFTTPAQWIVLALALFGGWLLGLASHPGGRRWRERYIAERDAHAANRRTAETHVADAQQRAKEAASGKDAQLTEANTRIADLERDNARLAKVAPVTPGTVTRPYVPPLAQTAATPTAATPVAEAPAKRGWFDWAKR